MTKAKKSSLLPLLIFQVGLVVIWYLGQKQLLHPAAIGTLMLLITAGIFYSIYKRIPSTKYIFLTAYLFIAMILVWLYILPSIQ